MEINTATLSNLKAINDFSKLLQGDDMNIFSQMDAYKTEECQVQALEAHWWVTWLHLTAV